MAHVSLHTLEPGHPLRNTPLGELKVQCRCVPKDGSKPGPWRDIRLWYIARASYNQLGDAWTGTSEFLVEAP